MVRDFWDTLYIGRPTFTNTVSVKSVCFSRKCNNTIEKQYELRPPKW